MFSYHYGELDLRAFFQSLITKEKNENKFEPVIMFKLWRRRKKSSVSYEYFLPEKISKGNYVNLFLFSHLN